MVNTLTTRLTKEQFALLPTEEDILFYEEHGWFISKKVLSDEIIDLSIRGSERFYQGERDGELPVNDGYSNWKPDDGYNIVRNNEFVSLQNSELKNLVMQPIIGAIASRLARTNSIRLLDDQLVYKPPQNPDGKSAVGWHADRAYWSTCTSHNLLTAWIPFHDCDESRGPLVVLDGSHKWSNIEDTRFFNNPNLEDMEQKFRSEGRKTVKVPMTLQKGQISFHHCWTIHGSLPNYSNFPRLAFAAHLQDEDNHYQPFWTKHGKKVQIADELMCRKLADGNPDFSDPVVFPVLFSKS
jgi:ectoine hydroxylase-related dioxygenase (phytanoyl-CoA dioxygenase family)